MSLICPICQENLINGESPENYVNKCGHVYHSNCILPWWDRAPEQNCPQCREPCNIDTITKLYLTVDHTLDNCEGAKKTAITIDDPKTEILVRQIKEHIDVQTYNQTKELNEKFRQQNSEFSTLLLNNITRLRSNYDDKLSAVSKELSTAISAEHKRLLTALDSNERPDHASYNIGDGHSPVKRKKVNKFVHPIAAITCLIAVVTLIVIIIYSHLLLKAIHTNEYSGSLTINNISLRLDVLNKELHEIADNASRDNKNMKLALENMGKSMGNGGYKTQEILNKIGEVGHRTDQLLLEQIQTDRRINLKLEVLENNINILKSQIDADNNSRAHTKVMDDKQNQLADRNRELETKLQHLQTILDKGSNLQPDELRREIEDDEALAPSGDEAKSIREKAIDIWNNLIHSDSSKSSSRGYSANTVFVVASTVTMFVIQIIFC